MSDHDHWADSVGAYLLGALPEDEQRGFEAHLDDCAICRREVETLSVAADALPASVPLVPAPPALKDRIMAIVESEAELLAAAGSRADEPEPARRAPRRRWSLGSWLMRPGVALACAAALLVAGGGTGVVLMDDDDRTVVAMADAPGADVRLEIRDDTATLVARDMPAPPEGRVYQVWLKRPGADPEPTSVLWSTREDGSAEVAVPGSLEGVEAVLVTDEPAGGSDTPTRPPIISASTP